MFKRLWCKTYKEFKEKVENPWEEYYREQKRMRKQGKPKATLEEVQDLIDIGFYTKEEIEDKFEVVES